MLCCLRLTNIHRKCSWVYRGKDEEEKGRYYEEVGNLLHNVPKHDMKIVIVKSNAKLNKRLNITGGNSKHQVNNQNGKQIIMFCEDSNMSVTMHDHEEIHKRT